MARAPRREEGFTLIELMVVVLVIAVLLAIAIPTFLAARERTHRRAAQSAVRNGFVSHQVYYAGRQEFTDNDLEMRGIDPALEWRTFDSGTDTPTETGVVYTDVLDADNELVLVAVKGGNGKCYWIQTVANPGLPRFFVQDECDTRPADAEYLPKWPD
jgi:type IV pilus assembly protein PilA